MLPHLKLLIIDLLDLFYAGPHWPIWIFQTCAKVPAKVSWLSCSWIVCSVNFWSSLVWGSDLEMSNLYEPQDAPQIVSNRKFCEPNLCPKEVDSKSLKFCHERLRSLTLGLQGAGSYCNILISRLVPLSLPSVSTHTRYRIILYT